jgi:flagellar basal-body rod modification protein FlgD
MAIQPTTHAAPAAAPAPANPKGEMGKDAFLKLLVAELKHQDPMDPMQAREMIAQLAQLSSVEKLSGIDTKLAGLQTSNNASATMQSAGLIGRNATGDTRRLTLTDTSNPRGTYKLPTAADTATIQVRDASGNVIRTLDNGAQTAGQRHFLWDGKTQAGARAPNGTYTFDVSATNKGVSVPATTTVSGLVTAVTYQNGEAQLLVEGAQIPLGDVTSIKQ